MWQIADNDLTFVSLLSKLLARGRTTPLPPSYPNVCLGRASMRMPPAKHVFDTAEKFWDIRPPQKYPPINFEIYKDIKATYGTFYAEIIPFPNAISLLDLGPPMFLPNALGGELEKQGLAKSFQTITSWEETLNCTES